MTEEFVNQMEEELAFLDLTLEKEQFEQFFRYFQLLTEWNQVMNLTAITEQREVVTKHFVDSLSLIRVWPEIRERGGTREEQGRSISLIDIGTGAGFPGLPLKIAFPYLDVMLLDSLNKRIKFLDTVICELGLTGIRAVHGRAEDLGREHVSRETFDLCVSRAVANLSTLSEYCIPLVKVGGCFIPYKSGKIEEELENGRGAVKKLGGEIQTIEKFHLPNADERSLIVIKKSNPTSKRYPRKAGMPSKEPLR